jgi:hypothetical protein
MKGDGIPLTPTSFPSYQCVKTYLTGYWMPSIRMSGRPI